MLWNPLFMFHLCQRCACWTLWRKWKSSVSEEIRAGSLVCHTFFLSPVHQPKATWIFLMLIFICWSRSNGMADCSSRTNTGSQYIYHLSFSPSDTPAPLCFLSSHPQSFISLPPYSESWSAGAFFKTESFWTILVSKRSGSKRHALWSWHVRRGGPSSLAGLWGGDGREGCTR